MSQSNKPSYSLSHHLKRFILVGIDTRLASFCPSREVRSQSLKVPVRSSNQRQTVWCMRVCSFRHVASSAGTFSTALHMKALIFRLGFGGRRSKNPCSMLKDRPVFGCVLFCHRGWEPVSRHDTPYHRWWHVSICNGPTVNSLFCLYLQIPVLITLSQDADVDLPVKPLIFALAMGACLGGKPGLIYLM